MEERQKSHKSDRVERNIGSSRKHKKRGNKKSVTRVDSWCTEDQSEPNSGQVPSMDYSPVFWQQTGVPHMPPPHNGQRLFTAMSDPSVCGYSTMPVAYTMEPVSMPPVYPLYRPVPQPNYTALRGRPRRNGTQNHHQMGLHSHQSNTANGYSSLQENRSNYMIPPLYQNGDYTSLPPTANNHAVNEPEELNSEHRRYSDPGLGPADIPAYTTSEDSDSGDSGSSITTIGKNNKLILSLVEQMTNLREANSQMFKELHETKLSLENVKAELIRVNQNVSSDYQPGMISDIISQMRQANKVLDETMMAKVNAIVEEKSHQRLLELTEIKEQLTKMTEEKSEGDQRIAKLEKEVNELKINLKNERREIVAFEEEALARRRELQEARATRNLIENHSTKLERLVAILHKKINLNDEEAIAKMTGYSSTSINGGTTHCTSSQIRSNSDDDDDDDDDDAEEDKDSETDELSSSSNNESVISNMSIGGPVTDL